MIGKIIGFLLIILGVLVIAYTPGIKEILFINNSIDIALPIIGIIVFALLIGLCGRKRKEILGYMLSLAAALILVSIAISSYNELKSMTYNFLAAGICFIVGALLLMKK